MRLIPVLFAFNGLIRLFNLQKHKNTRQCRIIEVLLDKSFRVFFCVAIYLLSFLLGPSSLYIKGRGCLQARLSFLLHFHLMVSPGVWGVWDGVGQRGSLQSTRVG